MMECYQAYADYADMMDLTEHMVGEIARRVLGTTSVAYQGTVLELAPAGGWPRTSMRDAIAEHCKGIDILEAASLAELREAGRRAVLDPCDATKWAVLVDQLFSEHVEPRLVQPCFVTKHPVDLSPLAKRCEDDARLVERFEAFVAGVEVGNAFSELNDPLDQRERFLALQAARDAGDDEAQPLDEDFLQCLEHGMPPTGGLGIGVDRLVMFLTDAPNLREVLLFPHMRPSPQGSASDGADAADDPSGE